MSRRTAATARAATLSTSHHRLLLAFAAALALIAAIPSFAHAAPASTASGRAAPAKSVITRHAYAQATATEFSSAARRHHHQRYVVRERDSFRGAYGYVPAPVVTAPSYGYGGYGYGYGDNSRNQTW
ncbi:hypothetical protein [Bradyrhizobium sp. 2TAF24]|uniref:hypothetical protein n=1 Tax=Bradyrhizobium sp. 2TAF24 TaxID=3233011 RepID=UPI003F909052